MYYIFHGDEEFGRSREIARVRRQLAEGDEAMADLNTSILDGASLSLGELRHACDSVPFLSDRRLVIVQGLLTRLGARSRANGQDSGASSEPGWKRDYLQDLTAYLPKLPSTTRLFFVETDELPLTHPVLKLAVAEGPAKGAYVRLFKAPREEDLAGWIQKNVEARHGDLSSEAVHMLAGLVGNDLRLLDQEIDKLLLYAGGRQVTVQDVRLLVSRAREASVFDLVDSVGQRKASRALRLLHAMLDDGEEPLYLLAMLARQVRLLIQVGELRAAGIGQSEIARQLGQKPFVVEKAAAQARSFDLEQLQAAHRRLVDTDWDIKTGALEPELALDLLVVDLSAASGPEAPRPR